MNTTQALESATCKPWQARRLVQRRRWLSVLTAMATATAVTAIADPIGGIDLVVKTGSGTFTVEPILVMTTTLLIGMLGWALLELLERWTRHAVPIWRIVAAAVFVVSLGGPFTALTGGATVVLLGLHVLVAAILVPGLSAPTPSRRKCPA
jgi:hypothetical protein